MIPRYSCPDIENIWSLENKYLLWMRIEAKFLHNLKGLAIVLPNEFQTKWVEQIADIEQATKHDVAAFVRWLETRWMLEYGNDARFVHYGLTSSDIVDTAFSLQLRATNKAIAERVLKLVNALCDVDRQSGQCPMIGRTHGQAAEIFTFSHKLRAYKTALSEWMPCADERYYGKLSGSIGDHKYVDEAVINKTLYDLDLDGDGPIDGQIIHRSWHAKHMNNWAVIASTVAKMALDLRLLSQSSIGEVAEGFAVTQVGSSSMPHKRNPIGCENLCGIARLLRGYQTMAMENIELWLEHDISHSSVERVAFPDAAVLLGYMLDKATAIIENLRVDQISMASNAEALRGKLESQSTMLQMIDHGCSRREAHRRMQDRH
jgi:adenylosuccinate lyase